MRLPGFVSGSYESQSPLLSHQRTVNWLVERMENTGAKSAAALYPTPGFQTFCTLSQSPLRALFSLPVGSSQRCFAVGGGLLYEVFADGTFSARDAIAIDPSIARIRYNGVGPNQLFVEGGTKGYIYNLATNLLTLVVDDITRGDFLETFFLGLDTVTRQIKISESNDGLTWDPAQVAGRSIAADPWISILGSNDEIILWGDLTGEVWRNTGASPFPFEYVLNSFFPVGIAAVNSAVEVQGFQHSYKIWLGRNQAGSAIVYGLRGYVPEVLSDHAMARAIQKYTSVADAFAWCYQSELHNFYVLTFPAAGHTWVLDLATMLWHERGPWLPNIGDYDAWEPSCGCFAFGKHLVGDRSSGRILVMSNDFNRDAAGTRLRRSRRAPVLADENKVFTHNRFEADVEVGLQTDATPLPQGGQKWLLRWSDDQGKTDGPWVEMDAGEEGQYQTRVFLNRLGESRGRIYELATQDGDAPARLCDVYIDLDLGSH